MILYSLQKSSKIFLVQLLSKFKAQKIQLQSLEAWKAFHFKSSSKNFIQKLNIF